MKIVLKINGWTAKTAVEFETLADELWDSMKWGVNESCPPDALFLINDDGVTMAIRNRGID